jgi:hypothetical protein
MSCRGGLTNSLSNASVRSRSRHAMQLDSTFVSAMKAMNRFASLYQLGTPVTKAAIWVVPETPKRVVHRRLRPER